MFLITFGKIFTGNSKNFTQVRLEFQKQGGGGVVIGQLQRNQLLKIYLLF